MGTSRRGQRAMMFPRLRWSGIGLQTGSLLKLAMEEYGLPN